MHDKIIFEPGKDIFLEGSDEFYAYIIEKGNIKVWRVINKEKKL